MIFYKSRGWETAGIGTELVCIHLCVCMYTCVCVCVHTCTHPLLSHSVAFLSASVKYDWIQNIYLLTKYKFNMKQCVCLEMGR